MNDNREIEVKIINIDVEKLKQRLNDVGAQYIGEVLQKYYVYDFEPISSLYNTIVDNLSRNLYMENNLNKLKKLFYDLDTMVNKSEKSEIKKLLGQESLFLWVKDIEKIDNNVINVLNSEAINNITKKYNTYPSKWIRLRQTGKKTTITVKQIFDNVNNNGIMEHKIDSVREFELEIDNIENGKKMLEELGYYFKAYQEKFRISYKYEDASIDIDMWPKIPPYLEIEADNEERVYEIVNLLGFSKDDVITMNTTDVYLKYGIDIKKYKELKFEEQK